MIPSPLRLENYFFAKIHVDACPNSCEKAGKGLFTVKVSCMKHKDAERKWMVQLELKQIQDKEAGCPEYTFHAEVVGFYEVSKSFPEEKAEALVRINGPALLYSAARELIATLTGRGPFAPVNLPTVTFIDEAVPTKRASQISTTSKVDGAAMALDAKGKHVRKSVPKSIQHKG